MKPRFVAARWTSARARFAAHLESNAAPGRAARLLASAWGAVSARGIARPLTIARGVHAIGVGGASLGGSYKTPFAIALARALAARGIDVALVGHAYRARPGAARIVRVDDEVAEVGDDALFAARSLAGSGVGDIVAPSRQAAATFAAQHARCLIFDGLLQTRPERLGRSILLLDGAHPLERAHCPPAGDLRAPRPALLEATDLVLAVGDDLSQGDEPSPHHPPAQANTSVRVDRVASHLAEAHGANGRAIPLSALRGVAVGLVLTIARPERVIAALARRGLGPVVSLTFPDHHRPSIAELSAGERSALAGTTHRIEAWLTTGKCATKLPSTLGGAPVLVLNQVVRLSDRLVAWAAAGGREQSFDFPTNSADALFPTAGAVR
jgi:tetraacyldisaccharide 4'-kinase